MQERSSAIKQTPSIRSLVTRSPHFILETDMSFGVQAFAFLSSLSALLSSFTISNPNVIYVGASMSSFCSHRVLQTMPRKFAVCFLTLCLLCGNCVRQTTRHRILRNHVRRLRPNHYCRGIRVTRRKMRHDGRINHAQTFDTPHAQTLVNDCKTVSSHLACPRLLLRGVSSFFHPLKYLVVGLHAGPRNTFLNDPACNRFGRHDLSNLFNPRHPPALAPLYGH